MNFEDKCTGQCSPKEAAASHARTRMHTRTHTPPTFYEKLALHSCAFLKGDSFLHLYNEISCGWGCPSQNLGIYFNHTTSITQVLPTDPSITYFFNKITLQTTNYTTKMSSK